MALFRLKHVLIVIKQLTICCGWWFIYYFPVGIYRIYKVNTQHISCFLLESKVLYSEDPLSGSCSAPDELIVHFHTLLL